MVSPVRTSLGQICIEIHLYKSVLVKFSQGTASNTTPIPVVSFEVVALDWYNSICLSLFVDYS